MKNRFLRMIAAILAAVLMLSGCTGQGTTAAPPDGTTAAPEESTPEETTEAPAPERKYKLSEDGEAIVDDVAFYAENPDDQARVFYEIFVGAFSDSDGDGVGDLKGIINRMDYLNDGDPKSGKSLGVEGIWLTPIFRSSTYHKYNVNDYYAIDGNFGSMDDLKDLIEACHARGVKLILDLVINHTGAGNPWFKAFSEAHRNGEKENEYYDWYVYYTRGESEPEAGKTYAQLAGTDDYYECNFSGDMPELNYDVEAVREAVLDVAKYYLDLGIDGFRFDAAKYIYFNDNVRSAEFWDWYIGELKAYKPDVYTVAEVWDGDGITDRYYTSMNCFNFTMSQQSGRIAEAAAGGDVNVYARYVESYLNTVRSIRGDSMIVPFITNHDMDRAAGFLTAASGRNYVGANLYLLGPGSPFLYYGEEIGMRGSRGGAQTDANRRLAMLWGDGDKVKDPSGSTYSSKNQTTDTVASAKAEDESLLTYYKRLIMIRKANPEIARGEYTALNVSGSKAGGFVSVFDGSAVMVLHNTTANDVTIDLASLDLSGVKGMSLDASYFDLVAAVAGRGKEEFDDNDIPFYPGGSATLEGTVITISAQTSVVLRKGK